MKKIALPSKMTRSLNKIGFKMKKHSPEILVAAGVVGTVASTIMACKATTKVNDILDESKETINIIHEGIENGEIKGTEYTPEDGKKDLTITYIQTGVKLAKLYGPSVFLGALSLGAILTSNNILKKRNVALAAAYTAIDNSFKDYRSRVVDRFGKEVDRQLKYNIKAKEVEETVVDENGEEKKVIATVDFSDPNDVSAYARFFEEYSRDEKGNVIKNPNWESNNEYNLMFLKAQQNYANDLLKSRGYLFLNEVYKMLGLPISKAGQVVGWVYDADNPVGDNYVDFGLYFSNQNYSDFIYGNDNAILLDFNVDGNIWEMM